MPATAKPTAACTSAPAALYIATTPAWRWLLRQVLAADHRLGVYPNPAGRELVQLALEGYKPGSTLRVRILTLTGQTLYQGPAQHHRGLGTPAVLQPGVYLVQATNQTITSTARLVVQ